MNDDEIPEDINVHKQIWGKDADEVIYGEVEKKEYCEQRCHICNSRIDEFGYCGCGGKLGVSSLINRQHNKKYSDLRSNGMMN
jgi:hypothetical protein